MENEPAVTPKAELLEVATPTELSPANLLSLVVTQGADLEKIGALMDLMERNEKKIAKKEYTLAMAAFKAKPPVIVKDQAVSFGKTSYNHASLGQVSQKINSALSLHGLTASWGAEQGDFGVMVTCTITHTGGHSESTSLFAPPDNSGGKNAIQSLGSSVSYLQRYTLLALTGLSTSENDDDGAAAGYSDDHIQAIKISFEQFKSGIDYFKTQEFTAEKLEEWFESKDDSFRLLSVKERTGLTEHLHNTFDWLDKNGKHGKKSSGEKPETVVCPNNHMDVIKEECMQSECHKACELFGNKSENKKEISLDD